MRNSLSLAAIGAAAVLALAAPAMAAHHGWGGNTEEMTLSATVVRPVSLSGPHATMQVRDADGQVWDVTLAPAPRTHASGLRDGAPPAGSSVTLLGRRNDDTSRFEIKTRRVTWNGQNYDVYSETGGVITGR